MGFPSAHLASRHDLCDLVLCCLVCVVLCVCFLRDPGLGLGWNTPVSHCALACPPQPQDGRCCGGWGARFGVLSGGKKRLGFLGNRVGLGGGTEDEMEWWMDVWVCGR